MQDEREGEGTGNAGAVSSNHWRHDPDDETDVAGRGTPIIQDIAGHSL